ncbi:MAG: hypothetical protein ACYC6N_06810 [Pirellulaceae bacterium]
MVVVTVVILLITLAAYGFLSLMQTENQAAHARGDQMQAEALGASGREYLAAVLESPCSERPRTSEQESGVEEFGGRLVDGDPDARDAAGERQGRFAILAPAISEMSAQAWRYGYQNESSKLHLATLLAWDGQAAGAGRAALMKLTGMDDSTADAILDWIDSDQMQRDQGAESDYYQGLNPPQRPRDGIPPTLDELLLVRGVTREKLFGVDVDANFRVDQWESDLVSSESGTSSSAALPWSYYLTVYSGEREETYEGEARVLLNQPDLGALHRALVAVLDPSWANFLVAYRQYGPSSESGEAADLASLPIDLSQPPQRMIQSPLELIGVRLAIPTADPEKKQIFASPFTEDPAQMREYLPKLMDLVTVRSGTPITGRVNINLAEREVLMGIPGIDDALAERILSARTLVPLDDPGRQTTAWLLTEGLVDRQQLQQLEASVTTRGDVGRAQIIGYYDLQGPVVRFETVVDGTERPARQVYYKDLRRLGRGVLADVIGVTETR